MVSNSRLINWFAKLKFPDKVLATLLKIGYTASIMKVINYRRDCWCLNKYRYAPNVLFKDRDEDPF